MRKLPVVVSVIVVLSACGGAPAAEHPSPAEQYSGVTVVRTTAVQAPPVTEASSAGHDTCDIPISERVGNPWDCQRRTVPTSAAAVAQTTTQPAPQFTRSEQEAIESARSYLSFTAFSRSGLIGQLEYEGFTTAEATLAVDHLNVDWNEQAWLSAENYLEFTSFSRSGLIDQLLYEGFTEAQATYGVDKAGM